MASFTPATAGDASSTRSLTIGLCGGGTVGGGVVAILAQRRATLLATKGIELRVKTILVRDVAKTRDFALPDGCTLTDDWKQITDDADIDCVVELIGGVTLAKDIVFAALRAGKHVVTANKALVAKHLDEIDALVAANANVRFGYEASVGGGIPCIRTLQQGLLGDRPTQVAGIMNGTTNFILTKMNADGADYADVLAEAQALGFAEADPTADVGGFDVRAKICILAKLAFGLTVDEEKVPILGAGITRISSADFAYAKDQLGCTVKLLGVARRTLGGAGAGDPRSAGGRVTPPPMADGGAGGVAIYVAPHMVPAGDAIAAVHGATNIVSIASDSLRATSLVGQGAGRFPTANSVVADLLAIALGTQGAPFPRACAGTGTPALEADFAGRFYVRFRVRDGLGIIRRVAGLCEAHGISIHSILQTPIEDPGDVPFALTTEAGCALSAVRAMCAEAADTLEFLREPPFFMPFYDANA